MPEIAIKLDNVSKHFGSKKAVNNVSFSVEAGACYGLIGPNGAGKTTTFSMLCGFLFPTHGTIQVLGKNPSDAGVLKGAVGVLPQDAVLPPTWPVGSLLTHLARLSFLTDPERQARTALDRVQLPETWDVPAGALSHGMAKRISMAQALMGEPPVIFLDEPTAGLDPKIAASVRQLIRELKGKHTLVVSSHNLQELEELCDATAILDKGRLVSAASMAEMTASTSEFRITVAAGTVSLDQVKAQKGCTGARFEGNAVLVVEFDASETSLEVLATATVVLLAGTGVLISGVSKGKRLEERVLQLT
jgi:ABC-2 type transport system ATP-binding protein